MAVGASAGGLAPTVELLREQNRLIPVAFVTDISQRRQAEQEISSHQDRLQRAA